MNKISNAQSAESENTPAEKRKRKTEEERLDDLIKGQQQAKQNLDAFRKKVDIKLLKSVKQEFGDNVTAARFEDAIAKLKQHNSSSDSDPNAERLFAIGRYVESITGPDITAEQFQILLEQLTRNIKPAPRETNSDGSPKTDWEKVPLSTYIHREYSKSNTAF